MFTKPEKTELDHAIACAFLRLNEYDVLSDEYNTILAHIQTLTALKGDSTPKGMSPDTKATVIANLVGIAMIVGRERVGVVTSKALSFVTKCR